MISDKIEQMTAKFNYLGAVPLPYVLRQAVLPHDKYTQRRHDDTGRDREKKVSTAK
jgi:hypothetical protein